MLLYLAMLDGEEERSKFTRIYLKYRYFMWYLANEILHDAQLSEDAVQEAFFALTRHLDKIQEEREKRTRNFLATVVRSKAIDMLRREHRRKEEALSEEEIRGSESDLLSIYLEKEGEETVKEAVRSLPDPYRVVFEYKFLHELSDREIADLLDITPKAVNVRIFRARKKLQELLRGEDGMETFI